MATKKQNGSSFRSLAEKILKDQGISASDWKHEVIKESKLAVLEDRDKQWLDAVLEKAAIVVIKNFLTQNSAAIPTPNVSYSNEGGGKEDGILHNDKE